MGWIDGEIRGVVSGKGVEGIRAARTERTGIYGHEGDVLGA